MKYQPNKKNGGVVEIPKYEMLKGVYYKCGRCIDCRRERANSWKIRLQEELKSADGKGMFVTMTFSDEAIEELIGRCEGVDEANTVAKKAIRLFLERIRKHTGRSVKHWFIVEIGGKSTERIHIHGMVFEKQWSAEKLGRYWKYGRVDVGYECSERTISYITKYLTKIDPLHKDFLSVILCSPGIGKEYIEKHRTEHTFRDENTTQTYRHPNGMESALPCYYRRKIWTDEEREEMRAYAELKPVRWLGKTSYRVETHEDYMIFEAAATAYREELERLGFPTPMAQKLKRYKTINKSYRPKGKSRENLMEI